MIDYYFTVSCRSSSDLLCTRRKQHSLLSTISSWLRIWLTGEPASRSFNVQEDRNKCSDLRRVIVYDGQPGIETSANSPQVSLLCTSLRLLSIIFIANALCVLVSHSWNEFILEISRHHIPSRSHEFQTTVWYSFFLCTILSSINILCLIIVVFKCSINKGDSIKDKEQKLTGNYFFMEDSEA